MYLLASYDFIDSIAWTRDQNPRTNRPGSTVTTSPSMTVSPPTQLPVTTLGRCLAEAMGISGSLSEVDERAFSKLSTFLERVPSVKQGITTSAGTDGAAGWWVKFSLDIDHDLAWQAVQELGHVLNDLSVHERLPTVFRPMSPPPYLNGGPREYLSWVIECDDPGFRPGTCADWLEGRLPKPVEDVAQWLDE